MNVANNHAHILWPTTKPESIPIEVSVIEMSFFSSSFFPTF